MLVEHLPLTFHEIAKDTNEDSVLKLVYEQVKFDWVDFKNYKNELEPYFRRRFELSVEKECLTIGNRVVVPNILILVDGGSKWIECWALNNTSAAKIIGVLIR